MIPSRENIGQEPSLIEDVVMPHAAKFTDPGREVVRRRSIGNLHQQYLRRKIRRKPQKTRFFSDIAAGPVAALSQPHYTVVPPLRKLHSTSDSLPNFSSASLLSLLLLLGAPMRLARYFGSKLSRITDGLPKKYSAASGVSTDWEATAWKARYAVPLVLILFILSLLLFGLLNGPGHRPGKSAHKPVNITQIPVTAAKAAGGKGGAGGKGSGSAQSAAAASTRSPSSSAGSGSSLGFTSISPSTTGSGGSSGTGGATVGMGGGQSGGGTTGGSGDGTGVTTSVIGIDAACTTTTCSVTGCTQPETISYGQKAVLVGGVCVVDPASL